MTTITKTVSTRVLDTEIEFNVHDLDTEVRIEGHTLCWISKGDINEFTKGLQALIDKHAI